MHSPWLKILLGLTLLYGVATQSSMAAMEILGTLLALTGLGLVIRQLKPKELNVDHVDAASFALITVLFLSLLFSPMEHPSWFRGLGLAKALLIFILLRRVFGALHGFKTNHLIWAPLSVAAASSLFGLYQFISKSDPLRHKTLATFVDPATGLLPEIFRATGFFSSSMTFGHGLLMPFILATGFSLFATSRHRHLRAGVIAVFAAIGIYVSYQRGPWLGMLAAVLVFLPFLPKRQKIGAIVLAVVGLIAIFTMAPGLWDRLQTVFSTQYNSNAIRLEIWRAHLQLFLEHPLFGVGYSQTDHFLQAAYDQLGIAGGFVSHGHNNVVDFLSGSGLLGLLGYLGLNMALAIQVWRQNQSFGVKVTWLALLMGTFVAGLTECSFKDGELMHQFFYWMALALPKPPSWRVDSPS